MMSISPGMGAGQAGGYFTREDYYFKGADEGGISGWHGKGAEALGLTAPVREEAFRALCTGRHPATGGRIVSPKSCRDPETGELIERHRAGNDCTFSAPKSLSIAYAAGVAGIKDAHDAAVAATLGHVEEHYTHYRSPDGVRSGHLVAASFGHATSRSLDPQLHTHAFLLNMVQAPDGSWKANWHKPIFQDQKSLGLLYRQELARELESRGFEIRFVDRAQMFFELKGIDRQLIEHFSSRREAIERQVLLWKEERRFMEVPRARLHEMAALETRDPKREVTREDVEGIFRRGFESCGTSMPEVKGELERARDLYLAGERKGPEHPAPEVVRLAAERLIDREAVLDRARLLDQAVLISGGKHSVRELNLAIDGGTEGVLRLGQDRRGREYYTTVEMRRLEECNLETIRGLERFRSVTTLEEVRGFVAKAEEADGFRVTAGQMQQIENELVGPCAVGATEGKAGTGKTLASNIIERFNTEILRPQGKEHFTVNVAFTGKAALEMASASGRPAYTVDAFLNAYARGDVALQRENEIQPVGEHVGERILIPAGAQVVLRVDEVSFVGAKQGGHLLRVVRDLQAQGVQAKLQLTGDTRQMQAIQSGDLFRQVLELGKDGWADVARLNEIRRQRDPDFLEVTRTLNRDDRLPGVSASEALAMLARRGRVVELDQREALVKAAVESYRVETGKPSRDVGKAAAGERQSVLLITSTNADRIELNRAIREARVFAGEIERGRRYLVLTPVPQGVTADSYRVGDEIHFSGYRGDDGKMQRWGARLNTVGTVTGIDPERGRVEVTYSFTSRNRSGAEVVKTVTKKLPAAEMVGKTTAYREEERFFSPGDLVIALRNDRDLGVQNGTLGVVQSLDERGRAVVSFGRKEITVDLSRYRHLDHAYAVTIHKSQGATVEHAILFAPVLKREEKGAGVNHCAPGPEFFGRSSYNALNVAITRAQYGACVFTNSLPDLIREVQHVDVKTSTLHPPVPEMREGVLTARGSGRERVVVKDLDPASRRHYSVRLPGGETSVREVAALEAGRGRERKPAAAHGGIPGTGNDFDRGAKLARRLDELREVTRTARTLTCDIMPKQLPVLPAVGKEIARQVTPVQVKEIDLDLGKS